MVQHPGAGSSVLSRHSAILTILQAGPGLSWLTGACMPLYLEHVVCLVQHQDADVVWRQRALGDPVLEGAVRADHHLCLYARAPARRSCISWLMYHSAQPRACAALWAPANVCAGTAQLCKQASDMQGDAAVDPGHLHLLQRPVPCLDREMWDVAVEMALMPVKRPILTSTLRFWLTSSRVGHTHSACAPA